ncbi:hypothetical protein Q7P37_009277 [Cladosporium fusiforme]
METYTIPPDPYAALQLNRNSSPQEIKARYYQLARRYHPNRSYGSDEAKSALASHFHRIHEAWLLLSNPVLRKRYLELIELKELQDKIVHNHVETGIWERNADASSSEDWASSDPDEYDLTHLSAIRRARSPMGDTRSDVEDTDRATSLTEATEDPAGVSKRRPRGREPERRETVPSGQKPQGRQEREGSDAQAAEKRRRKIAKYKKKEMEALHDYTYAMLAKFAAEEDAERTRMQYETAKWKREKAQNAPREISTRVRLAQQVNKAVMAFRSMQAGPKLQRRPTLNLHRHILGGAETSRDGDFLTVSSPTAGRQLGSQWRGWSSDISGDQTSSESDGGSHSMARKHTRSPATISARRKRPDASPLHQRAFSEPDAIKHTKQVNGDDQDDPPFRLVVKRPTGFDGFAGPSAPESSDGSASPMSGSSRSPSPYRQGQPLELVLFSQDVHDANITSVLQTKRTMSAPVPGHFRHDSDPDLMHTRIPESICTIKVVGDLRFPAKIPRDHVHKLELADEARLLRPPSDEDGHPEQLLRRLARLDEGVARKFMVKPDIKSIFAFRLICSSHHSIHRSLPSFIALSYRRKRVVEKYPSHYTLPLEKEMLQAVWEERISEKEGLWIDQICIDQDSDEEKTISMSAMDLVYRSARLVVVALDDLELTEQEGSVLKNHVIEYERLKHVAENKRFRRQKTPYLEAHDDLLQVLQKILSSSWFRRAWCRHEMRLARDHVFLLPCRTKGPFKRTVLRLTSSCIAHLLALATEVPFDAKIELLKPALHAFFRDRTQPSDPGEEIISHHGNFTTVVAEVFGMEAGGDPKLPASQREADARRDKVSIILNTMECGLALRHDARSTHLSMSKEDCYYSLLLLALAARDPGALCSVGKPLYLPPPQTMRLKRPAVSSWLFEPTNVDAGLNNYRTLDRLPTNSDLSTGISHGSHFVQLNLHILDPRNVHHASSDQTIFSLAQSFLKTCESRKYGRHRKRYLIHDAHANANFGSMRAVYEETLACVFACGPEWMSEVCARHGMSRFKIDLEPAYWLMAALHNMRGQWPNANWTKQAAEFIMDFVNFLVIRGMPQRQLRQPEAWRPSVAKIPNGGKVLMFRPPGDDVTAAVPSVLLDVDYVHLSRLWMLTPRKTAAKWTLVGKSVMFGDDAAVSQINCDGDEAQVVKHQQKVFGRDVGEMDA